MKIWVSEKLNMKGIPSVSAVEVVGDRDLEGGKTSLSLARREVEVPRFLDPNLARVARESSKSHRAVGLGEVALLS